MKSLKEIIHLIERIGFVDLNPEELLSTNFGYKKHTFLVHWFIGSTEPRFDLNTEVMTGFCNYHRFEDDENRDEVYAFLLEKFNNDLRKKKIEEALLLFEKND